MKCNHDYEIISSHLEGYTEKCNKCDKIRTYHVNDSKRQVKLIFAFFIIIGAIIGTIIELIKA